MVVTLVLSLEWKNKLFESLCCTPENNVTLCQLKFQKKLKRKICQTSYKGFRYIFNALIYLK